jgi:general secretion pathway protein G
MKSLNNSKGMTLLEIMIVLAIIGSILAAVGPRIFGQQDKAKVQEAKLIMSNITSSLNMYYTDCGKYPDSLEGLVTADSGCANWGPEAYIKKIPTDPWGAAFVYEVDGGSYVLKSLGKDKKEGGDGYGKDITSDDGSK